MADDRVMTDRDPRVLAMSWRRSAHTPGTMIDVRPNAPTSPIHRRPALLRAAAVLLTLIFLAGSLSGCVRVRAAMAVTEDDRVSGEFVVAIPTISDNDPGPKIPVPPEFKNKVRGEPYKEEQFSGTRLAFDTLTFDELNQLVTNLSAIGTAANRFTFSMRRSGELVIVDGMVDLTSLPKDRTDVKIKISFPGKITTTNGSEEDGTLSWNPRPGEITELSATVEYAGSSGSWTGWLVLVFGLAVAAAAMVGALALITHRRSHQSPQDTTV